MGLLDFLFKKAPRRKREIPREDALILGKLERAIIDNGHINSRALAEYERAVAEYRDAGYDTQIYQEIIVGYKTKLAKQSSTNLRK